MKLNNIFLAIIISASLTFLFACSKDDDANLSSDPTTDQTQVEDITPALPYVIVGTNQTQFFNNTTEISAPASGTDFYGQDASYQHNTATYRNNLNGTITDMHTALVWQQTADQNADGQINVSDKMTLEDAKAAADNLVLGGYDDWRLPTIKELYSLILFSGIDPSGYEGTSTDGLVPFIDTQYFGFNYGDQEAGERIIDAQFASSTQYVHYTMGTDETLFGVNFADGRIKGYGLKDPQTQQDKTFYVLFVRGNTAYGTNDFTDNNDGTVTDNATRLMWQQADNGQTMNWQQALAYAENATIAGHSDWRLPTAKELQSIIDYSRSPATTNSPAIDPVFTCTQFTNEAGQSDYGFYWSGTTHQSWASAMEGANAAYCSFGRAMGYMSGWTDVHGAGAQRSDPKAGNPDDYPEGHGPQGDAIRIYNYVRLVRNVSN